MGDDETAGLEADQAPDDIVFSDMVMCVAFHPMKNIVAASTVDGLVELHEYSLEQNKKLVSSRHHTESCRTMAFGADGSVLYTASTDASIAAFDLGAMKTGAQLIDAHDTAVSCISVLDEHTLASGDDDGVIKIWDLRQQKCCHELREHGDFISDMQLGPDGRTLLCSGGDGYVSVWNRKSGKLYAMSDQMDDELLCMQILKGGRKVLCGTQSGTLHVFSWGLWGDVSDRFPGHPQSVQSMVKVDEQTVITCSEDGIIRVVQIQPNKLLGVIGEHDGYPVECLSIAHDLKFLASCAHDNTVKFWGVEELYEDDGEGGEGMGSGDEAGMEVEAEAAGDAMGDGSEEEEWESDDSDEVQDKKKGKKGKGKAAKKGGTGGMKRGFFDDM